MNITTELAIEGAGAAADTCVRIKNNLALLMGPQSTYTDMEREHMDVAGGVKARKECLDEVQELAEGLHGYGIRYCQELVDWAQHLCSRVPLYPTVEREAETAWRAVNELQFFYLGMHSFLVHNMNA